MKDKGFWTTMIFGFVFVSVFLGWIAYTNLNNPKLLPAFIGLPIFIIAVLFAVFGKDLFRKQPKTEGVK